MWFFLLNLVATVNLGAWQALAITLAGILSLFITEAIKRAASLKGGAAALVAGAVSLGLAVGAFFLDGVTAGEARTWADLIVNLGGVALVSQVLFKITFADAGKS